MEVNQEKQDAICGEVLRIYETLIDTLQPEYTVPWVEPEFVPGHPCYEAYSGMHNAYGRLRQRLGAEEEDADAEEMIDCLLRHGKLLAMEMFRYGRQYQKMLDKEKPDA